MVGRGGPDGGAALCSPYAGPPGPYAPLVAGGRSPGYQGPGGPHPGSPLPMTTLLLAVVAFACFVYLLVAVLRPERF